MKYLVLSYSSGDKWGIPLELVAKNRAEYYQKYDKENSKYQEDYDAIMNDDHHGVVWFRDFKEEGFALDQYVPLKKNNFSPFVFGTIKYTIEEIDSIDKTIKLPVALEYIETTVFVDLIK